MRAILALIVGLVLGAAGASWFYHNGGDVIVAGVPVIPEAMTQGTNAPSNMTVGTNSTSNMTVGTNGNSYFAIRWPFSK